MITSNPMKILYVDDDESYQNYVKDHAKTLKFDIELVDDFAKAKNLLSSRNFDAIILEYKLKRSDDKSGFEFLEYVRNVNQKVTIIILTDHINQDVVIKAIRLSIDDFIPKSTNIESLPEILINRIEKRKKLFGGTITETQEESQIKGNLFENFLILKGSIPILIFGNWNDESTKEVQKDEIISQNEFLMSGFLSAIQNFSSNFFGQSVEEISLASSKMILISKDEFTACLKIDNILYRSMYTLENKRILINTLEKILGEVILFSKDKKDFELLESTKNRINHLLTESSIKTQLKKAIQIKNNENPKKSYFNKLKQSFSGKKVQLDNNYE